MLFFRQRLALINECLPFGFTGEIRQYCLHACAGTVRRIDLGRAVAAATRQDGTQGNDYCSVSGLHSIFLFKKHQYDESSRRYATMHDRWPDLAVPQVPLEKHPLLHSWRSSRLPPFPLATRLWNSFERCWSRHGSAGVHYTGEYRVQGCRCTPLAALPIPGAQPLSG